MIVVAGVPDGSLNPKVKEKGCDDDDDGFVRKLIANSSTPDFNDALSSVLGACDKAVYGLISRDGRRGYLCTLPPSASSSTPLGRTGS